MLCLCCFCLVGCTLLQVALNKLMGLQKKPKYTTEEVGSVLQEALQALQGAKAVKAILQKAMKAMNS